VREKAGFYVNKFVSEMYTKERTCILRDSVDILAKIVAADAPCLTSMLAHVDDHACPIGFSRAIMNRATIQEMETLLGESFTTSHILGPNAYRQVQGLTIGNDRNCDKWFEVNGKYHLLDVLIMTWWNHGIHFNHENQNKFMGCFSPSNDVWLSGEVLQNFFMKLFIALYMGHVEIGPILEYRFFHRVLPLVIFAVQRAHKAIESISDLIADVLVSKKFPVDVVDLVSEFFRPDYQPLILELCSKNAADIKIPDANDMQMTPRFYVNSPVFEQTMGFPIEEVMQNVTGDFRPPQGVTTMPQQNGDYVMVMPRQPII